MRTTTAAARTVRVTAAALAALLVTTLGAAVDPAPAGADMAIDILYPGEDPLTWVDDTGAQYVVATVLTEIQQASAYDLVIGRMLPDGRPDADWGTYADGYDGATNIGVRKLELEPPAPDLRRGTVTADDAGILTVAWASTTCGSGGACERWYSRHDATGAQVAVPAQVPADAAPSDGLDDGSFLTGSATSPGWRGPDGADRGAPDLDGEALVDTAVDHSGRLLITTDAGRLLRWPAGGPFDLEMTVDSCPVATGGVDVRLARSTADDSFATICAPVGTDRVEVEHRDATGSVNWSATAPAIQPEGEMTRLSSALVDDEGRVWVGGSGPIPTISTYGSAEFLQTFTEDGAGAVTAWRNTTRQAWYEFGGRGFAQLREAPGDRIAYVDEVACCRHPLAGDSPESFTIAGTVGPGTLEAPYCEVMGAEVSDITRTSAHLQFDGCWSPGTLGAPGQPTGYTVSVTPAGAPPHEIDVPVGEDQPLYERELTVAPGVRTEIAITPYNRAGEGTDAGATELVVVAPFASVTAFIDRQVGDLLRGPHEALRTQAIADVTAGTTAPAALVDGWLDGAQGQAAVDVRPVARLYEAFFLRGADTTGLDYWVKRRQSGERLAVTASKFAGSSEFQRRYGSLSNRAFVAKLYRNVFDRDADPSGLAYWTRKLDTRALTRGGVVAQFSESSENLRRSARYVEPLAASYLMLGRAPSSVQRTAWAGAGDPQATAVTEILASQAYAASVLPS